MKQHNQKQSNEMNEEEMGEENNEMNQQQMGQGQGQGQGQQWSQPMSIMTPTTSSTTTTSTTRLDDDSSLSDFLSSLIDYTPTIPDELVEYYLSKTGFQCPDVRLIRLVSVATQKFISDIATDALMHCKARQSSIVKDKRDKQQKDKRLILTMEDLSRALREQGVNLKQQEYFADSPSTGVEGGPRDE